MKNPIKKNITPKELDIQYDEYLWDVLDRLDKTKKRVDTSKVKKV